MYTCPVGCCAWTSGKGTTLFFPDILVWTIQFEPLWMPVSHIQPKSFFLDVSGSFLRIWSHFPEGEGCRILSYWLLLKVAVVISKALQVT